jgi:hypothetical protein
MRGASKRPARSVHLWWRDDARASRWAYNEVVVTDSCPATYFCVLGWNSGYCGLQELGDGSKVAIFSCWDPNGGEDADDARPELVPVEKQCRCLERDAQCDYARFGNEGTGARCLLPFAWKVGSRYRFIVRESEEMHGHAGFTCWLGEETQPWRCIARICIPKPSAGMTGLYSFVEDFGREAYAIRHRCLFGPCVSLPLNDWKEQVSERAKFTAAGERGDNIDASTDGQRFVLETGGRVAQHTRLDSHVACQRVATRARFDLPWQRCAKTTGAYAGRAEHNELSCRVGEEFVILNISENFWEAVNVLTGARGWLPNSAVN